MHLLPFRHSTTRRNRSLALALVAFLALINAPVLATDPSGQTPARDNPENAPDIAHPTPTPLTKEQLVAAAKAGEKLAEEKCAACHAIGKSGDSANKDAPPFRDFAAKWPLEALEESLAEGIVTGHEDMPEFVLEPAQITEFLEFLRTLQKQ